LGANNSAPPNNITATAIRFRHAALEEVSHDEIGMMIAKLFGIAGCELGLGIRIEKHAVVADRKDTCQLVCDDDDRCTEAVPKLQYQIVEQLGADRIQPRRGLVEEQNLRVHGHCAGEPGAFFHATRNLVRVEILETGEADERELVRADLTYFGSSQIRVLLER
jgi:hypothetical protein